MCCENSKSCSTLLCLNTPHEANLGQIMHDTDNLGPITHHGKPFCHLYLLSFFIPTTGYFTAKLSQHPGIRQQNANAWRLAGGGGGRAHGRIINKDL